ncbi:MAG: hypothetical protein ABID54_09475, partial [Pseudomonadota bacterium]
GDIRSRDFEEFGLCKDCSHLNAFVTTFGSKYVICEEIKTKLKPSDPVKNCSCYWKRHSMELGDMMTMAILIDLKRKIGFVDEEDEYDD